MKKFAAVLVLGMLAACGSGDDQKASNSTSTESAPVSTKGASEIVAGLKATGLPVDRVRDITAETDGNKLLGRPNQYVSKTDFVDGRAADGDLGENTNQVEVFATEEDAKARFDYVDRVSKSAPMFNQYLYLRGKVVLRLSNALTPEIAKAYEAALDKVIAN